MDMGNGFNKEDSEIGIYGDPPEILVLTLPIGKYANDDANGTALVFGKIREAQAEAMKILIQIRQKKAATSGLIKPVVNGDLKVH